MNGKSPSKTALASNRMLVSASSHAFTLDCCEEMMTVSCHSSSRIRAWPSVTEEVMRLSNLWKRLESVRETFQRLHRIQRTLFLNVCVACILRSRRKIWGQSGWALIMGKVTVSRRMLIGWMVSQTHMRYPWPLTPDYGKAFLRKSSRGKTKKKPLSGFL